MIADVLVHLYVDDVADLAGGNTFFNGKVKRRVTQHVADHDLVAVFAHAVYKAAHFCLVGGERLLKKHVVSLFQKGNSGFHMLLIHRAVDYGIRKFRYGCQRRSVLKAVFFGKAEHLARLFTPDGVGIGNAHDPKQLRLLQRQFCINNGAMPRADDHGGNRFLRHIIHPVSQNFRHYTPTVCKIQGFFRKK